MFILRIYIEHLQYLIYVYTRHRFNRNDSVVIGHFYLFSSDCAEVCRIEQLVLSLFNMVVIWRQGLGIDKVLLYTRSWSSHGLSLHKGLELTRCYSRQDFGLDEILVYTRSSRHRWELSRVKGPFLKSSISLQNYNLSIAAAWSNQKFKFR